MRETITLDSFSQKVKDNNTISYLEKIVERVNNGEGYLQLVGYNGLTVILIEYTSGWKRESIDCWIEKRILSKK